MGLSYFLRQRGSAEQAHQTIADQALRVRHDPFDQLGDGRDVVDQAGDHAELHAPASMEKPAGMMTGGFTFLNAEV